MPITHSYSNSVEPPGPVCAIKLSYDARTKHCWGLLDSGADYTCLPEAFVKELSLDWAGQQDVEGATGEVEIRNLYYVNLEFLGLAFARHIVISVSRERDYVLIGRDILNCHRLIMDGPAGL